MMLKALMKVRVASLGNAYFGKGKNNKPASKTRKVFIIFLFIYLAAMFSVMFFGLFSSISLPLESSGLGWLYFAMYALMDFILMFVGSVFVAKVQLFEAKDNDLLLSMPIPPGKILFSRFFVLWLINSFFNIMVSVPAGLAWIVACKTSLQTVLSFIVLAAALPFLSLAASALFGWILSLVTMRIRNKTLFTTLFSLMFFAVYMYVVNQANTFIEQIAANGELFAEKLGPVFILSWIGHAIAQENLLYLFLSILFILLPFAAVYAVLSRTFIKTVTVKHAAPKKIYKQQEQKISKPSAALFRREKARFFSSSVYILNAGFGSVMSIILGVTMIFYMPRLLAQLAAAGLPSEYNAAFAAVALSFLAGMTNVSAASVSIEGKHIWISHSLPVATKDILLSKLKLHMLISGLPVFIASLCFVFALKAGIADALICLIMPQLFAFLNAVTGLCLNIKFPVLDWENETQAVKTGTALLITVFAGMLSAIAAAAGIYLLSPAIGVAFGCLAVIAIFSLLSLLLYSWLMKKGAAIYDRL